MFERDEFINNDEYCILSVRPEALQHIGNREGKTLCGRQLVYFGVYDLFAYGGLCIRCAEKYEREKKAIEKAIRAIFSPESLFLLGEGLWATGTQVWEKMKATGRPCSPELLRELGAELRQVTK